MIRLKWAIAVLVLTSISVFSAEPENVYVSIPNTWLKDVPKMDGKNLVNLSKGSKLQIQKSEGKWYKVRYSTNENEPKEGYISSLFVSNTAPIEAKAASTDTAEENPFLKARKRIAPKTATMGIRGLQSDGTDTDGYKEDVAGLEEVERQTENLATPEELNQFAKDGQVAGKRHKSSRQPASVKN